VHAIALDSKYGVPTVAIHTNAFEKAVQSVTRMHGMPEARYTFVPQPVMGKSAEQLRAYVPGDYTVLGTEGFGRSDSREKLRYFFEVNRHFVVIAALKTLADQGKVKADVVSKAIKQFGIDPEKADPMSC
jgi:pyruvate dehydrogenase complex dehydrogenase (E1) component